MSFLKSKKYVVSGITVVLILVFWLAFGSESEDNPAIYTAPERGTFKVEVTTTGELRAKNSTSIRGPEGIREFRIWNVPIQRLIPEGTVVEKGDFVAELDRSEITSSMQDAQLELEEAKSAFESAKLDSALTLSEARDNLINLEYALEEAKIAVEQSQYESPATQRQVKIDMEQAQRELRQAQKNYETQVRQAELNLQELSNDLIRERREVEKIQKVMKQFTIFAPENGMVIYKRNRDGTKITEGSSISAWDPVVAQLPDFSVMNSVTYVNEVDIQNIRPRQQVDIGLDAMPDKKLTGVITDVANIGEQHPNSDSKVFQVVVEVNEADTTLRPAMTTSNTIHVNSVDSALYVPLEAIHTQDSLDFVFKRNGMEPVMQQVVLGLMNDNDVIIKEGVEIEDQLYLSTPTDTANIEKDLLSEEVLKKYRKQEKEIKADPSENMTSPQKLENTESGEGERPTTQGSQ